MPDILESQKQKILKDLEDHEITKHIVDKQKIIDYMLQHRIKQVQTYILLCEQLGWCIGTTTQPSQENQQNLQLTVIQLEAKRLKSKQKQDKQNKKLLKKLNFQQQQFDLESVRTQKIYQNKTTKKEIEQQQQPIKKPIMRYKPDNLNIPLNETLIEKSMKQIQEFILLISEQFKIQ